MKKRIIVIICSIHITLVCLSVFPDDTGPLSGSIFRKYHQLTNLGSHWFFFYNGIILRWEIIETKPLINQMLVKRGGSGITDTKVNRLISHQMYLNRIHKSNSIRGLNFFCKKYPDLKSFKIAMSSNTISVLNIIKNNHKKVYDSENLNSVLKTKKYEFDCHD